MNNGSGNGGRKPRTLVEPVEGTFCGCDNCPVRSVLAPFVAMPFVPSSFLLLVAMPGAPSSFLLLVTPSGCPWLSSIHFARDPCVQLP